MNYVLITFLILSHKLLANDFPEMDQSFINGPVQTLHQINRGDLLIPQTPDCNKSLELIKKNNKALYNQCAVDLCGPAENNVSHLVNDKQFIHSASLWKKLKVYFSDSTIKQIYETAINKKLKELSDLKKYLIAPTLENMSLPGQIAFTSEVFSPYVRITPKLDEMDLENKIEITILPLKDTSAEIKEALNDYVFQLKKSVLTNPLHFNSLGIYTDQELAQIIKEMIKKIKDHSEKNPNVFKDNPKFVSDLKLFEYLYASEKIPHRTMLDVNIRGLTNISNYMSKITNKDALNQVNCNTPACKKIFAQYLEKSLNKDQIKKNIALYEETLQNPDTKKNAINRCKANIIYKETKNSDDKKARTVFLQAKNSIEKNLLPHFSEHSRKVMSTYLNNQVDVNTLKLSGTEDIAVFKERAKNYLASADEFLNEAMSDDYLRYQSIKHLNDSFEEIDPLGDMYACDTTSSIWDAFIDKTLVEKYGTPEQKKYFAQIGNKDQIFASDFSCQNADHGHYILTHEIGHALSSLLLKVKLSESSLALYNKGRACVTSNYINAPAPKENAFNFHQGDSLFSEEDMADFLAVLSTPQDKKIYFCALLKTSPMTKSYIDLKFINSHDPHSSPFTRVIFEAINKNINLPTSCQQLIKEEKPTLRFNKCEL